ncbi:MAG: IPT/TIG domain-containing protein [Bacillota bacterium]
MESPNLNRPFWLALIAVLAFTGPSAAQAWTMHGTSASSTSRIAPVITGLNPSKAIAGVSGFKLVVKGMRFGIGSTVQWNGAGLATVYVSTTELTASVPAGEVAVAGQANVTVADGNLVSQPVTFSINNPVPVITDVQPTVVIAGTLTVFGKDFVATSIVRLNNAPLVTTYVNSGELQAAVPIANIVGGQAQVGVFTPAPGGGFSNLFAVIEANPLPTASTATVEVGIDELTLTGKGFVPQSVIDWNGTPLSTWTTSSTVLHAYVSDAQVNQAGSATVMVTNPTPGGGDSNGIGVTLHFPLPAISFFSRNGLSIGGVLLDSLAFTLSLGGSGFTAFTTVYWDGMPLTVTFVNTTDLDVAVPAALLTTGGEFSITAVNPGPGGGTSNTAQFAVINPVPVVSGFSPDHVDAGGADFTLKVLGSEFVPGATVQWNGNALTTTYVSGSELDAQVPAADIAAPQTVAVSAINPHPNQGPGSSLSYAVGYQFTTLTQTAKHEVWDPVNQVIYLSVPSTAPAGQHPGSILVLDPSTASVVNDMSVSGDPNVLALSGDSSYLYAGLDTLSPPVVQRFTLPGIAPDISFSLGSASFPFSGNYSALDIQVAPGAPHTVAVSRGLLGSGSIESVGGVTIFDDGTPRPAHANGVDDANPLFGFYDSLQWGADDTALYSVNTEDSGWDFYVVSVSPTGAALTQDYPGVGDGYSTSIHYDASTDLVYTDLGVVIDPHTGTDIGSFVPTDGCKNSFGGFATLGVVVSVDSANNKLFMACIQPQSYTNILYVESFDLTTHAHINTITLPAFDGYPRRLIRWGANGLAILMGPDFMTPEGLILVHGQFVN